MSIISFFYFVNIISFVISLVISFKTKIKVREKPLPILFLIPLIIAFFFLAGIAISPLFLIVSFLSGLFLLYYSIKNEETVLSTVVIEKAPVLIAVLFLANFIGGTLFSIARYATSGDKSVLAFILISGIFLIASSRAVLFSLITYLLKQKGYSKKAGFILGILGFFGLLITLILANNKPSTYQEE